MTQERPLVSIVIPAYNAATFIEKTLDSVRAQAYASYEVLVVDDGSRDDTHGVVEAYLKRHKMPGRCIKQANKKIAGARNTGIHASAGDFISFLDHDDLWFPEKLSAVMAEFGRHPEADVICHNENIIKDGAVVRTTQNGPAAADMYESLLFKGNRLSPSAVTVRKSLLLAVGGFREDEEFNTVEDYDLWMRLAKAGRIHFMEAVLGQYLLVAGGASNRIVYHNTNLEHLLRDHFASYPKQDPLTRLRMRKRLAAVCRGAARGLLAQGDVLGALRYAPKAAAVFLGSPSANGASALALSVYAPSKSCPPWTTEQVVGHDRLRCFSLARWALVEALRLVGAVSRLVLVPEFICREVLASLHEAGAKPLFYRVGKTLALEDDPATLPEAAAILAVNYFGFPQDLAPFKEYCRRTGAVLIEDNAHGLFSRDESGQALGTRAPLGIFSLRKTVPLPNGAALSINDERFLGEADPQLEFLKDAPCGQGPASRSRAWLRPAAAWLGARGMLGVIEGLRLLRGAAAADAAGQTVIPGPKNPCALLASPLRRTGPAEEAKRRKALYRLCEKILVKTGAQPVFARLPGGTVPYGFPFYADAAAAARAEKALHKEGLSSLPWPDLPDAVRGAAPAHYTQLRLVHFLW